MEQQVEEVVDAGAPPPEVDTTDQPQSRMSVRESLQKTFDDARVDEQREQRRQAGRFSPTGAKRGVAEPGDAGGAPEASDGEVPTTEIPVQTTSAQPPAAWAKEAKDSWAQIPNTVRAAVLKREEDVQRGVNELKARYQGIDDALKPHVRAIEAYGKTPAQAVDQLFKWFQALSINPDQAFPALLRSYNYPPERLMQAFGVQPQAQQQQQQPQTQPQQAEPPQQEELPPYVTSLQKDLEAVKNGYGQHIYQLQTEIQRQNQAWAEQNMARTHESLNFWAKDKPYFEEVRQMMGHLLTPDQNGVAPIPLKDGQIDLDEAYNRAMWALPDVRAKILADQQGKAEAERKAKADAAAKAQKEKVESAKRAATSIRPGTPSPDLSKKDGRKGKSVRESLMASIDELNA